MKKTLWLLAVLAVFGCTENRSGNEADVPERGISTPSDADIPFIDADTPDEEADSGCCGVPCHCGEEYEYQQQCWKTQMFFCTPDGHPPGDDPALYMQALVLDVCDANGEPCTPAFANDPDCQWQVVSMGECENWLECDPTNPDIIVNEDVPCTDIDENGEEYTGLQDFTCEKGQIMAGPCVPCEVEICDAIDNDCDGVVDEGEYPCESECGPGNALCIEGELVLCDAPLPVPEVCDGLDNDCDALTDEELLQGCETDCEQGVEFCIEGAWTGCTAQPPMPEECNGLDDDCNGLIDDGLDCACPPEMIGFLIPCMEDPLLCGQGFKSCECADENCVTTQMTQCFAMCHWLPEPNEVCDPTGGTPVEEICNNFDDDCDELIDEDLMAQCYTGPEGTVNVGVCAPGDMLCVSGQWGNFVDEFFVEDMCLGEVTPLEEDLCTGQDDNCDGVIENVLEDTDVLFIVDTSGSMSSTINAVQQAMGMFSTHYADQEVVQWGLVVGPIDQNFDDTLHLATNLVPFNQFLGHLATVDDEPTSSEMLYDALLLSIRNLVEPGDVPALPPLNWGGFGVGSDPSIDNWHINWREDVHHVVIIFSDEHGQSFLNPMTTQPLIQEWAAAADDLSIYTFSKSGGGGQIGPLGWEPVSVGGSWFQLTANPQVMFDNLMDILEETACGGEDAQQGAWLWDSYSIDPLLLPIHRTMRFSPAAFGVFQFQSLSKLKHKPTQCGTHQTQEMWLHLPTQQCIHPNDVGFPKVRSCPIERNLKNQTGTQKLFRKNK